MKRIDADYHVGNLFQSGNPLSGQRGTRLDHTWLNAVQEELASVIEGTGTALDPSDHTQLLQAINALISQTGTPFDTFADLVIAIDDLSIASIVRVMGHDGPGDGGGFIGVIEADEDPLNPGGKRARPIATYNPKVWGAKADGSLAQDAINATIRNAGVAMLPPRESFTLSGSVIPGNQDNGKTHSLRGWGAQSKLLSTTSAIAVDATRLTSVFIDNLMADFAIEASLALCVGSNPTTTVGLKLSGQAGPVISGVSVTAHREAAFLLRDTYVNNFYHPKARFSNVGFKFLREGGAGVNATTIVSPSINLVDAAYEYDGDVNRVIQFGGSIEGFNELFRRKTVENNYGATLGFDIYGAWIENFGPGTMELDDAAQPYKGTGDRTIRMGDATYPKMTACNIVGDVTFHGGYAPLIANGTFSASASIDFNEQITPGQFELINARSKGWGVRSIEGFAAPTLDWTLPLLGEASTQDEKYGRQGVYQSAAIVSRSGIWRGDAEAAENLIQQPLDVDTGNDGWRIDTAFPGFSLAIQTGRSDPWGAQTAVSITGGSRGTFDVPGLAGGGKWVTFMVICRAITEGEVYLEIYPTSGGSVDDTLVARSYTRLPDTKWRIVYITKYIPPLAGKGYRVKVGAVGAVDYARVCMFEGTELLPPVVEGAAVDQPFTFDHDQIEITGIAAPTTGTWRVGDRLRFRRPSPSGHIGLVCTVAGTPGTWKNYGYISA